VIKRFGEVAYELELPKGSRIHNSFHLSCLKKALGQLVTTSTDLPLLDEEGQLVLAPEHILDVQEQRPRNIVIRENQFRNSLNYCNGSGMTSINILSHKHG
jgi:hypothetical protein